MVHDFSPFLIQFSDTFGVRWYGLSYIMGFIAAYLLMVWLSHRQRTEMNSELVGDFITYIAIGTLVGGRLGYCLFYSPDLFTKFKESFPYWGVLAVNEGGMASHGGMIGITVACLLFARKHHLNVLHLFDLVTISGPIGVFFGRIANFINGELVGRPAPPDFPLAVKFPQDMWSWAGEDLGKFRDITGIVEKLGVSRDQWNQLLERFTLSGEARNEVYEIVTKIINEIQNGNTAIKTEIAPFLIARYPSQLFEAVGEGLLVFLILFFLWRRPRKSGFIASMFCVLYGIFRIIGEQFRMPDAHIGFQLFGMTRGQWLSIALVAIGLFLMFWWSRTTTMVTQGWGKVHSIKLSRK
ncbi:MAG: prolipoprotein diacylglyceryl transferase [Bdellovibrionota bacterium]